METKIIKATKTDIDKWEPIIRELSVAGLEVYKRPMSSDISIVLGGRYENPLAFSGYRVLAYNPSHWPPSIGNSGFGFFKPLLEEYYDELIEVDGSASVIIEYVRRSGNANKR